MNVKNPLSHAEVVDFVKKRLAKHFPGLKIDKDRPSIDLVGEIPDWVQVPVLFGDADIAVSIVDAGTLRNGVLEKINENRIKSKCFDLTESRATKKILVITDFQAFVQFKRKLSNTDKPGPTFVIPESDILVILLEYPLFENNGWVKSDIHSLTFSNILSCLKFGKITIDNIPETIQVKEGYHINQRELVVKLLKKSGFRIEDDKK